jgi:4-hydroxy-2-oxoheptanedioate aldolase
MARINRVIELFEAGQPVYHEGTGPLTYDNGVKMAGTWADYLLVDFEHSPFDTAGLLAFMRGLVDGGPTRSGHRTPTVMTTLPSNCRTREEMLANSWQARHVLSTGAHGILHTHTRQAAAVQAFIEACRYPFQTLGVGAGLRQGQRGAGGQRVPAEIWGVTPQEYVKIADPWPLNPDGELLLGLKVEDRECLANVDDIAAIPGVAFGEWGPGDLGMSFGEPDAHDPPYPPEMEAARLRIKAAYDRNGVKFLSGWNDPNLTVEETTRKLIDEGVTIIGGGEEAAKFGRVYTKREMTV